MSKRRNQFRPKKDNTPLDQVSVASKASDATRILNYCTVNIVVQDTMLFQLTLINNNQASDTLIIVICYDIIMFMLCTKKLGSCCTFVLIIIYGFDLQFIF